MAEKLVKSGTDVSYLVTLFKVFDVNFINADDSKKIEGLNVNDRRDVVQAVRILLIPDFGDYLPVEREAMVRGLRESLRDPNEKFERLFARIALDFQDELLDPRGFMETALAEIEPHV